MARLTPGIGVVALIAVIVTASLGALFAEASGIQPLELWQDTYLRRVVRFTFWQALLSTALSISLALVVTRSLARQQRFRGRSWLIKLLGLPLVIPTIVAVFGIVAIYGQTGLVNSIASRLGLQPSQYLYGLTGILIAHVFFNLPLAIRLLLPTWESVSGESWRLAAQLGMSSKDIFRVIEWPLLRQVLPQVVGLVFMLCFTSFAVVLTLGGGPAATTIEVAIYQALRFDFDLGRAGLLAVLQLGFCALLVGFGHSLGKTHLTQPGTGRPQERPDLGGLWSLALDYLLITLVALSTLLPLGAVILAGLAGPVFDVLLDSQLWSSALLSLSIALVASTLALLGGVSLLLGSRELRVNRYRRGAADAIELSGSLILVIPPLVLGAGFFILLRGFSSAFAWGLAIVVLVNALMGLPYVIRVLGPPMTRVTQQHDRLCASLGIHGWERLKLIEWPLLRAPIGLSLALCAALSTGDLGVIALFGSQDLITLPLLLYQRLASYQMDQAAVTALVLLGLCLALFHAIERGIGGGTRD